VGLGEIWVIKHPEDLLLLPDANWQCTVLKEIKMIVMNFSMFKMAKPPSTTGTLARHAPYDCKSRTPL